MVKQDARLSVTTEALNNIKMLKLYAWTGEFEKTIDEKRNEELAIQWKRFNLGMLSITTLYFFP